MESFNHALFLLIYAGPVPSPWMLQGAVFFAKWLVFCLPLLLVGMWLWGASHFRAVLIKALLAVVVGIVVVYLVRLYWPHPRPFVVGLGKAYLPHAPDSSFPSNHAVFCFSIAWTFLMNAMRKTGWLVFLVGFLVSWARVFLGVHFPLDMAGALVVAFVLVMAVKHSFSVWGVGDRLVVVLERVYRRVFAVPIAKGWILA